MPESTAAAVEENLVAPRSGGTGFRALAAARIACCVEALGEQTDA